MAAGEIHHRCRAAWLNAQTQVSKTCSWFRLTGFSLLKSLQSQEFFHWEYISSEGRSFLKYLGKLMNYLQPFMLTFYNKVHIYMVLNSLRLHAHHIIETHLTKTNIKSTSKEIIYMDLWFQTKYFTMNIKNVPGHLSFEIPI